MPACRRPLPHLTLALAPALAIVAAACFPPALEQPDASDLGDLIPLSSIEIVDLRDILSETHTSADAKADTEADLALPPDADAPSPECHRDEDCQSPDLCIVGARCEDGRCLPGAPNPCPAIDSCHGPGLCDPQTGRCTTPRKPDGADCDDGDVCTANDRCSAGVCAGTPGRDGVSIIETSLALTSEDGLHLAELHATDERRVLGLVASASATLTASTSEYLHTRSFSAPAGAVSTLFLADLTHLAPASVTATAFAWTDAPSTTLAPAPSLSSTADRQLLVAARFSGPFLARSVGVLAHAPPSAPSTSGVAILRLRYNGDVASHLAYHVTTETDPPPMVTALGADAAIALVHPHASPVLVSAPNLAPELIPARTGEALATLIERRGPDGALRFRRVLSAESGHLAAATALSADGELLAIAGVATGPILLEDGAGAPLATLPTGLGAIDGFILWLDAEGGLARWRTLFGEPGSLAIPNRLAAHGDTLVLSTLTNSPLLTRTTPTGLGAPVGPFAAPPGGATTAYRTLLIHLGPGTGPDAIRAGFSALGPEDLALGGLTASSGLVAFALNAAPVLTEGAEPQLPAPGHALALEGLGHSAFALVARDPQWDAPAVPYDPYAPAPVVGALSGAPRVAIPGGARVYVGGAFHEHALIGHRAQRQVFGPQGRQSAYLLMTNLDHEVLCEAIFP